VLSLGQTSAQLVKMKFATQTRPRNSCGENGWPS